MNNTTIFVGKLHRPFHPFLNTLFAHLHKQYDKIIIPAVGEFTVAEIAKAAGFEQVLTSDISLYSTVIAGYALGTPYDDFVAKYEIVIDDYNWTRICEKVPPCYESLMLLMKVLQLRPEIYFERMYVEDYIKNAVAHCERITKILSDKKEKLRGVKFYHADLTQELLKYADDPKALIILNPPNISKVYTKLFAFENVIKWKAPSVPQFDPKTDMDKLYTTSFDAKAFCVTYGSKRNDNFLEHAIGIVEEKDKIYSVIVNRKSELPKNMRFIKRKAGISAHALNKKIVDDSTVIDEKSTITFMQVKQDVALYYRSLWCHRLGVTKAECYYMWIINGEIAGVVGFNTVDIRRLRSTFVYETFGFSAQAKKHPRLNRLLMMCMVSKPTLAALRATIFKTNNPLIEYEGIKTTCLTKYRENRANKGVLTLTNCEKQPNDTYMLKYETKWFDRTYEDCLKIWLKESYGKSE